MNNEVTIEQMNEAIAEFMELEKEEEIYYTTGYRKIYLINGYWLPIKKLKYHKSWDWLMPVVEKIEQSGCIVEIWLSLGKGCRIQRPTATQPSIAIVEESNSTIDAVYKACYQVIVYLNQQKQTNDERGTNKG